MPLPSIGNMLFILKYGIKSINDSSNTIPASGINILFTLAIGSRPIYAPIPIASIKIGIINSILKSCNSTILTVSGKILIIDE